MKEFHMVSYVLVVVGALNWGLYGLFGINLVHELFGQWMSLEKVVYVLVGVAAVFEVVVHKDVCKMCAGGMGMKKK